MIANKAHLTGVQQESVLADLRSKFGTRSIEKGLKLAIPALNRKYAQFFTSEDKLFMDTDDCFVRKKLYYCHSPVEFLNAVNRERGREGIEQVTLVVGDTGQGFLKISVSQIPMEELENNGLTRIPGPGLVHLEKKHNIVTKSKKRTIQEDGVLGGDQFKD